MKLLQAGPALIGICWLAVPAASPKAADQPRAGAAVRELISQLGAKEFLTREQASAALEQQGDAALPALRQALAESRDLEIRVRAERLIAAIEQRHRPRYALQRILTHAQAS
jgi:HEAT repeat protein